MPAVVHSRDFDVQNMLSAIAIDILDADILEVDVPILAGQVVLELTSRGTALQPSSHPLYRLEPFWRDFPPANGCSILCGTLRACRAYGNRVAAAIVPAAQN
jgi:hypothetical protein